MALKTKMRHLSPRAIRFLVSTISSASLDMLTRPLDGRAFTRLTSHSSSSVIGFFDSSP